MPVKNITPVHVLHVLNVLNSAAKNNWLTVSP
jgi:hypothetical protein